MNRRGEVKESNEEEVRREEEKVGEELRKR